MVKAKVLYAVLYEKRDFKKKTYDARSIALVMRSLRKMLLLKFIKNDRPKEGSVVSFRCVNSVIRSQTHQDAPRNAIRPGGGDGDAKKGAQYGDLCVARSMVQHPFGKALMGRVGASADSFLRCLASCFLAAECDRAMFRQYWLRRLVVSTLPCQTACHVAREEVMYSR